MTIAPEGARTTGSVDNEKEAIPTRYDSPDPGDRPPAERITVALIPEVMEELKLLQDRTSLSRTDITNRAITLYMFIDQQLRAGHEVLIRERRTGEMQTVLIQ